MVVSNKDLVRRLDDLEKKYDGQFKVVFEAIRQPMAPLETSKRKISFLLKDKQVAYGKKGGQGNKIGVDGWQKVVIE